MNPDDILELDSIEASQDDRKFLIIEGDNEDFDIPTPFPSLPPSEAIIPVASERQITQALDNLFAVLIGVNARGLSGEIKYFDVTLGNDSVGVKLYKIPDKPLSVSITTMGFFI